jgi:hypothetical protein
MAGALSSSRPCLAPSRTVATPGRHTTPPRALSSRWLALLLANSVPSASASILSLPATFTQSQFFFSNPPPDLHFQSFNPLNIRMTARLLDVQPELQAKWASGNPLGRLGQVHELRGVVTWLASDASTFCTGSESVSFHYFLFYLFILTDSGNLSFSFSASSSVAVTMPGKLIVYPRTNRKLLEGLFFPFLFITFFLLLFLLPHHCTGSIRDISIFFLLLYSGRLFFFSLLSGVVNLGFKKMYYRYRDYIGLNEGYNRIATGRNTAESICHRDEVMVMFWLG